MLRSALRPLSASLAVGRTAAVRGMASTNHAAPGLSIGGSEVHGFVGAVGNTPLIRLGKLSDETGCNILAKAEFMSPGGSIKDRAALFLVKDAEAKGLLRPGGTVVEGTAGNTGIGLAHVCRSKGYKCVIYMPDTQVSASRAEERSDDGENPRATEGSENTSEARIPAPQATRPRAEREYQRRRPGSLERSENTCLVERQREYLERSENTFERSENACLVEWSENTSAAAKDASSEARIPVSSSRARIQAPQARTSEAVVGRPRTAALDWARAKRDCQSTQARKPRSRQDSRGDVAGEKILERSGHPLTAPSRGGQRRREALSEAFAGLFKAVVVISSLLAALEEASRQEAFSRIAAAAAAALLRRKRVSGEIDSSSNSLA